MSKFDLINLNCLPYGVAFADYTHNGRTYTIHCDWNRSNKHIGLVSSLSWSQYSANFKFEYSCFSRTMMNGTIQNESFHNVLHISDSVWTGQIQNLDDLPEEISKALADAIDGFKTYKASMNIPRYKTTQEDMDYFRNQMNTKFESFMGFDR